MITSQGSRRAAGDLEFYQPPANAAVRDVFNPQLVPRSLIEQQEASALFRITCDFCHNQIHGTPYNPQALICQVTSPPSQDLPPCVDDDDDDASEMDSDCTPQDKTFFWAFDTHEDMFPRIRCCTAICWIAQALLTTGENSPIGICVMGWFPSLVPRAIGGSHFELYQSRRLGVPISMS